MTMSIQNIVQCDNFAAIACPAISASILYQSTLRDKHHRSEKVSRFGPSVSSFLDPPRWTCFAGHSPGSGSQRDCPRPGGDRRSASRSQNRQPPRPPGSSASGAPGGFTLEKAVDDLLPEEPLHGLQIGDVHLRITR